MVEILLSFSGGFFAALIGVIAGSGGLISLGVLLFMGVPFTGAIATNRFASFGATFSGLYQYNKAKKVDWKLGLSLTVPGAAGSLIGAQLLVSTSERLSEIILAMVLTVMIPFVLFNKQLGLVEFEPSRLQQMIGIITYFGFGILAGMFGVGIGTVSILIIATLFGKKLSNAVATNLVAWLLISATALAIFMSNGLVNFKLAIPMIMGMFVGGTLGAKIAVAKGDKFIKIVLVSVQFVIIIKLLFF